MTSTPRATPTTGSRREARRVVGRERPRRWRLSALSVVVAVLCLGGISVALYPATAQWFSASEQAEQIRDGVNDVHVIGPASRVRAIEQAETYNALLDAGAAVQANERLPVDTGATLPGGFDYAGLLAANRDGLMGRIVIPRIGADLPIYHGTSDATLAEGVGHLEGSSLPVGGKGTHAVLAGHRGLATSALFTDLDQVRNGDTFSLYVFGETLTYEVKSIKIVDPDDSKSLNPVAGRDLVTLVTCTPIGINSQRILVTGERVTPTPPDAIADGTKGAAGPGFPWWAVGFVVTLSAAGWFVWWCGLTPKTRDVTRDAERREGRRRRAPEPNAGIA